MKRLAPKLIMTILLAGLLLPSAARPEVIGPLLEKSTFELGLQWRELNREFYRYGSRTDLDGDDYTLLARYGLTRQATLSGELYIGNHDLHNEEQFEDRYYLVGAGLQTRIWEGHGLTFHFGAHYHEMFAFNQVGQQCNKHHRSVNVLLVTERTWRYRGQEIIAWTGPGYFFYGIEWRKSDLSSSCNGNLWESSYKWGWTAGLNLIFMDHYQVYFSAVQIDKFQPRAGVMYRF